MATTSTPRRPPAPAGGSARPPAGPPARSKKGRARRRRRPVNAVWQAIKTGIQAVLILILVAIITVLVTLCTLVQHVPSTIDLTFNPPGRTLIFSSDDVPLARLFTQNRQVVAIEKIPDNLQKATIAFEDKRFYQHGGIDLQGILRALTRDIRSGDLKAQGGSTITQQLARNLGVEGLTREKSVQRKFHEWIVANQIEHSYTKQEILAMYLNDVYYGSEAYGVQAAAQTYFGKDVQNLNLAQCALLAGLPNRPNELNPYKAPEAAKAQRDIVLSRMLEQHDITPKQYLEAKAQPIHLANPKSPTQGSQIFHASYFVNYVIEQLKKKYGKDYLEQGNLRVYTSLNWTMQQIAEEALQNGIASASGRGPTEGCLVALDPKNGEIKAMVGGVDYKHNQINYVTRPRQPGSSFKAVIYSAAIDSGVVSENTTVADSPISFRTASGIWTPKDDNGWSYRRVDLRTAMAYSINVPAVRVLHELGTQTAIRYANLMGVTSPLDPVLSLALGSSGVTPLEMASVYSTFADGGNHPNPTGLIRLEDAGGKPIEDVAPSVETHILSRDTVRQLDDMLRAVVTEPRGTGAVVADVPEARGKTGTTQGHKDVWFVGYTPELVCAVWAGHPTRNAKTGKPEYGAVMAGNAWGSTVCAPIWRSFMLRALPVFKAAQAKMAARHRPKPHPAPAAAPSSGQTAADSRPDRSSDRRPRLRQVRGTRSPAGADGTTQVNVDNETGLRAPAGAPNSHVESFPAGAEPTVMSPQYDQSAAGDSGSPDSSRTPTQADSSPPGPGSSPVDAAPVPRPRRDRSSYGSGGPSQYVTVLINPDDGLLATKWCPQVVERRYLKGHEPHRYSTEYPPPPGEQ